MPCTIDYQGGHEWHCRKHDVFFVGPAGPDINDDGDSPNYCPEADQ